MISICSVFQAIAIVCLLAPAVAHAAPKTITVNGNIDDATATITINGNITATNNGTTWTASNVPLEWGDNTITAVATDPAGNVSPPAVITVKLGALANVQGTVTDASAVTVVVNGASASVNGTSYSAQVPLPIGPNTITAHATDASNNSNDATANIYVARPPVEHP